MERIPANSEAKKIAQSQPETERSARCDTEIKPIGAIPQLLGLELTAEQFSS